MNDRLRNTLFALAAALLAGCLVAAFTSLPTFGRQSGAYRALVLESMEPMRHAQQAVAAVTFDYRGFDTLAEEFILFAAVAGGLLLLRRQEDEETREPTDQAPDRAGIVAAPAVLGLGVVMFPFTLLLGIYVVLHGHLTPGGGFQGGVLVATAFYYVYLSGEYGDLLKIKRDHLASHLEAAGAMSYAMIGALPLLSDYHYMRNLFPLGVSGELLSTGTLPLLNTAVGIEVASAFVLLIAAFLRQVLVIRREKKS
ncbi:MnhB domain-containing protein [Geomonas ferrireducens]|uniref:MnhB domain-containing protein n=1 Tax=Geomonas ferrireducens TaxID=2570227 RepID=UPI0010A7990C|nr:MnhB domain-containing protein [Geomonas ferrireducens]